MSSLPGSDPLRTFKVYATEYKISRLQDESIGEFGGKVVKAIQKKIEDVSSKLNTIKSELDQLNKHELKSGSTTDKIAQLTGEIQELSVSFKYYDNQIKTMQNTVKDLTANKPDKTIPFAFARMFPGSEPVQGNLNILMNVSAAPLDILNFYGKEYHVDRKENESVKDFGGRIVHEIRNKISEFTKWSEKINEELYPKDAKGKTLSISPAISKELKEKLKKANSNLYQLEVDLSVMDNIMKVLTAENQDEAVPTSGQSLNLESMGPDSTRRGSISPTESIASSASSSSASSAASSASGSVTPRQDQPGTSDLDDSFSVDDEDIKPSIHDQ